MSSNSSSSVSFSNQNLSPDVLSNINQFLFAFKFISPMPKGWKIGHFLLPILSSKLFFPFFSFKVNRYFEVHAIKCVPLNILPPYCRHQITDMKFTSPKPPCGGHQVTRCSFSLVPTVPDNVICHIPTWVIFLRHKSKYKWEFIEFLFHCKWYLNY